LHHSQKIKDKEQGIIEITVIPNRELEAQLLWFGDDVEVLLPETLRQQIAEKIAKMHKIYNR
jgi:predicted DNA-binding transcriptional regulator YafY